MKGKHSIVVRNRRVQFALELERNITVIRGDSATGKTTMLGMLRDYEELGAQSGVAVQCDKPCRTLTSRDWESQLSRMKDSIVFVDECFRFFSCLCTGNLWVKQLLCSHHKRKPISIAV